MMAEQPSSPNPPPEHSGIVSVNDRLGSARGIAGKLAFLSCVTGLLLVAGLFGYNKYRAARQAQEAKTQQTGKNEVKPAQIGIKRDFDKEQDTGAPPLPGTTVVPDIEGSPQSAEAIGVASSQPASPAKPSRYGGDSMLSDSVTTDSNAGASYNPNDPVATAALINNLVQQSQRSTSGIGAGSAVSPAAGGTGLAASAAASSPPGSIGSQLTASVTPMVSAALIGDRNMVLPKGRAIDCGLSIRLVNDLPGLASCVLSRNVYSDNGKVVLLERGSEAVGEYGAAMAQGQKRLFVLWTRIKTPNGVVISLNSPGADDLGTTGLPGIVNNHWWERIGAAFLLSIVEDAIAYKTAETSGANGTGGVAVYQNTSQTGNQMAQKILDSTINIKPTLYKHQGDRSTIYVARDLDFGSVYALRSR